MNFVILKASFKEEGVYFSCHEDAENYPKENVMRDTKQNNGIQLMGIAGTHVVLLGWDMAEESSQGVLGFAIHRTDFTENEAYWLKGTKVFKETDPILGPGGQVSTRDHPIQGFTWSDFTAKPGHTYTYRVIALRGSPADLHEEERVKVTVTTESEDNGIHEVWFNRGAAASQEYARRFMNEKPSVVGEPAYRWLSRGLQEAMSDFIGQANSPEWGLRVAAYQFTYPRILEALHQAKVHGADVQILYDARDPLVAGQNKKAAAKAHITDLCLERSADPNKIAHNKFMVLLHNAQPVAVWTGSTNFTEGGIFGHSNVGHVVRNPTVAQKYLEYWERLHDNPLASDLRPWVGDNTPTPEVGDRPAEGTSAIFSPRSGLKMLDWYADLAASASNLLCMTFAFGINQRFYPIFEAPTPGLRYALMDSEGSQDDAKQQVLALRKKAYNRFAVGSFLPINRFDHWLRETLTGLNEHARFIHTKFMLVDPLGDDPIVVTGSANFSDASTRDNDENMLVVRGDQGVADIYLTEYMRLWNHYAFREWAADQKDPTVASPAYLSSDDLWRIRYYGDTERSRQRMIFAGTLV
jgi:phosphatidylserine/phosphatidylglycerophosphate/cardiolipin synthase-like enzyme